MIDNDCIFCKIVSGEIASERVFQDELVTAFRDINPVAPVHILIIPNVHVTSTNELSESNHASAARLLTVVPELAKAEGVFEKGYRLILNAGEDGRQEVMHLHMHLIGGRKMIHPMG